MAFGRIDILLEHQPHPRLPVEGEVGSERRDTNEVAHLDVMKVVH